ncbi:hypothetical protein [Rhizosaccharibacter radicis]|uniref:Anti-sigma factor n=1 Tax=Rhizosaccharibacter radicis TaxID=2782605 RepID=A0ABT1W3Y8_9PROT|nr:hypothetical protein [Acetobacteraceae bacterium KSS12]
MSDSSSGPDEDRLLVAGEYVLGTLPADERDAVRREADQDPLLADAIADWERRFHPLLLRFEAEAAPVPVPGDLWERVLRSLDGDDASRLHGQADARFPIRIVGDAHHDAARPEATHRETGHRDAAHRDAGHEAARAAWRRDRHRRHAPPPGWRGMATGGLSAAASGLASLFRSQPFPVGTLGDPGSQGATFLVQRVGRDGLRLEPLREVPSRPGQALALWARMPEQGSVRFLGTVPPEGFSFRRTGLPERSLELVITGEDAARPVDDHRRQGPRGPILWVGTVDRP